MHKQGFHYRLDIMIMTFLANGNPASTTVDLILEEGNGQEVEKIEYDLETVGIHHRYASVSILHKPGNDRWTAHQLRCTL